MCNLPIYDKTVTTGQVFWCPAQAEAGPGQVRSGWVSMRQNNERTLDSHYLNNYIILYQIYLYLESFILSCLFCTVYYLLVCVDQCLKSMVNESIVGIKAYKKHCILPYSVSFTLFDIPSKFKYSFLQYLSTN